MFEFHEKRKLKGVLYSKPFLAIMCIPVFFMLYAAFNAHEKVEETSAKRAELTADLAQLEKRATDLEEDIVRLDDPRGVESELRSRYEVGWEGEEVIVFVDEESDALPQATKEVEEEEGFFHKFFSIF